MVQFGYNKRLIFYTSKPALVNCSPVSLISLLSLTGHVPPSDQKKKKTSRKKKLRKLRIETLTWCACIKALLGNWLNSPPVFKTNWFYHKTKLGE